MKLTKNQLKVLRYVLRSQIEWEEGGCFGDGDKITDKRGHTDAKTILEKIETELTLS